MEFKKELDQVKREILEGKILVFLCYYIVYLSLTLFR